MKELLLICKLVRMSVFGAEEDILAGFGRPVIGPCINPEYSGTMPGDGINWPEVFADAGVNGVSAICYEAVKRLPPEYQPDFNLMVRWDLSAQGIREGYHHRHEVTRELRSILEKYGMDMLLLKGETLADNYPQPDIRESGDVDFVALPNYLAANSMFRSLGIKLKFQQKHSSFSYKGVHFENHTLEHTGGYNRTHRRTMALLREALPNAVRRADGCLELDPVTSAVFVVKHTAQHICYSGGRIPLRMLLDLALVLKRHPAVLEAWDPKLGQVGLERFAEVMLCVADTLLETGFRNGWGRKDKRLSNRFIRYFLTDSPRAMRYFVKFGYLPLTVSETVRICIEKIKRLINYRP